MESRTYYEVVIESCDRKTNEFCGDREVQKTFDDRYYAQEFFDKFDIAEWYNLYVYDAKQKQYYTVLSLVEEMKITASFSRSTASRPAANILNRNIFIL